MTAQDIPGVAPVAVGGYRADMAATRLFRFLTLLALLLAPFGMTSAHQAMAAPAAHAMSADASRGHCGGADEPSKQRPGTSIDCTIACSAVSAVASGMAEHPIVTASVPAARPLPALHGLHPESDPPPPRFA